MTNSVSAAKDDSQVPGIQSAGKGQPAELMAFVKGRNTRSHVKRPEQGKRSAMIRERVLKKLTESREADDHHPYLQDNEVSAYDLSLDRQGNLLAVGVDLEASFTGSAYIPKAQTMLTITPEGRFRQEKWAATVNSAIMIGHRQFRRIAKEPDGCHEIYLAQDYATGAFLHEGIGGPVAVALRPSDIKSLARILRRKFPRAQIIVCLNNPEGYKERLERTVKGLKHYGVVIIYPDFSKREREYGLASFNDRAMMTQPGAAIRAVKELIQKKITQRLEQMRREYQDLLAAVNGSEEAAPQLDAA